MIKMAEWEALSKDQVERAMEIHRKSIVIDTSIAPKHGDASFFERAEKGGVTACNSTMLMPWDDMRRAIEHIAQQYMWLRNYSERGALITSAQDIEDAKEMGKTGIIFGPQNADMIEDKLYLLEVFHRLGVRIIQPTYNNLNLNVFAPRRLRDFLFLLLFSNPRFAFRDLFFGHHRRKFSPHHHPDGLGNLGDDTQS